jgi:S1-C subfamily serine protease
VIERTTLVEEGSGALLVPPDQIRNVAAATVPSIVTVEVSAAPDQVFANGTGSGVIFDEAGLIVTNDHVIAGASEIKVILADGLTYTARLVGTDPVMDIAVLGIDATGLPALPFADIDAVEVGDLAIAVGNPLGLDGGPSVTTGVVSALDRRLDTVDPTTGHSSLFGLLQTDAPITRGSSGGALLDGDGELIGITTAIGLSDVGAEGLGFAVPVDLLQRLIDDLVADGIVRHAFLGISGVPAFEVEEAGVEVPIGARITDIVEGSPLGAAGARVDDVIVALDDEPISSMTLLVARLRHFRAGEQVEVTVSRDGTPRTLQITLDERPED